LGSQTPHVLGAFAAEEEPIIEQAVAKAADAAERWITDGPDAAMNEFNV
jgi:peptidyl-tRNA hydrolase